jgi:hypothetical protein
VQDSLSITCPHCGESFSLAVDLSEGSGEFVVDCEICCRPMTIALQIEDGEIASVDVAAE